jgi:hypothetical protein
MRADSGLLIRFEDEAISEQPESFELTELGLDLPDFSMELHELMVACGLMALSRLTGRRLSQLELLSFFLSGRCGLQSREVSLSANRRRSWLRGPTAEIGASGAKDAENC